MYSLEEGIFLVRLARESIEKYLEEGKTISPPKNAPEKLKQKAGIFVTLEAYPDKNLRGCIGYPEPIMPLIDAVIKAGISSATQDPRFTPLQAGEMEKIIVEVSVLTPPELIRVKSPKEYPKKIEIGRDGLIVEKGFYKGLLLPQVPVDEGWDAEEFLSYTCMKAGMMADCWYEEDAKIYKFEGRIFSEVEPKGEVIERSLKACK